MKTIRKVDCQKFIKDEWGLLACLAWKRYLQYGRGSLVLQLWESGGGDIFYVPLKELNQYPVLAANARLIESYDPRKEIAVAFPLQTDVVFISSFPRKASPPKVFKRRSAI